MPRSALHKAGQYLLIVALFTACGGHWAVLQSVAWMTMMVSYSHDDGVTVAIAKTFDGKHPCALCKSIQKEKQSDKKRDVCVDFAKLDFVHQRSVIVVSRSDGFWALGAPFGAAAARREAPSVPPPRFAQV